MSKPNDYYYSGFPVEGGLSMADVEKHQADGDAAYELPEPSSEYRYALVSADCAGRVHDPLISKDGRAWHPALCYVIGGERQNPFEMRMKFR